MKWEGISGYWTTNFAFWLFASGRHCEACSNPALKSCSSGQMIRSSEITPGILWSAHRCTHTYTPMQAGMHQQKPMLYAVQKRKYLHIKDSTFLCKVAHFPKFLFPSSLWMRFVLSSSLDSSYPRSMSHFLHSGGIVPIKLAICFLHYSWIWWLLLKIYTF